MAKMHSDEVDIDISLVRRLLAGQFPQWAGLPIEPVQPLGTDNAIYRLGDAMAVRLPRRERTSRILWALSQALAALSYYSEETNPILVREAHRWMTEILAEPISM